jgi:predicted ATP-grasp superfamily ATP-dependent carboligase
VIVFLAETDNIAVINDEITDLKASISLINLLKESFQLPIEKKYTMAKIDEITRNLQNKKEKLERELDSFQIIDKHSEEKRKSLYI